MLASIIVSVFKNRTYLASIKFSVSVWTHKRSTALRSAALANTRMASVFKQTSFPKYYSYNTPEDEYNTICIHISTPEDVLWIQSH